VSDPFTRLAAGPCPALADVMLAVAGEFGTVDRRRADDRLDEVARMLFGLAGLEPITQAEQLVAVLHDALAFRATSDDDPAGLLLDQVLEHRRGDPLLIAVLGSELALRAGVGAAVYCSPTRWFVGLPHGDRLILLDARLREGCGAAPRHIRGLCPHEVAFCVLTGLARRYAAQKRHREARHAARLRLALPIDPDLHDAVVSDLETLDEP